MYLNAYLHAFAGVPVISVIAVTVKDVSARLTALEASIDTKSAQLLNVIDSKCSQMEHNIPSLVADEVLKRVTTLNGERPLSNSDVALLVSSQLTAQFTQFRSHIVSVLDVAVSRIAAAAPAQLPAADDTFSSGDDKVCCTFFSDVHNNKYSQHCTCDVMFCRVFQYLFPALS